MFRSAVCLFAYSMLLVFHAVAVTTPTTTASFLPRTVSCSIPCATLVNQPDAFSELAAKASLNRVTDLQAFKNVSVTVLQPFANVSSTQMPPSLSSVSVSSVPVLWTELLLLPLAFNVSVFPVGDGWEGDLLYQLVGVHAELLHNGVRVDSKTCVNSTFNVFLNAAVLRTTTESASDVVQQQVIVGTITIDPNVTTSALTAALANHSNNNVSLQFCLVLQCPTDGATQRLVFFVVPIAEDVMVEAESDLYRAALMAVYVSQISSVVAGSLLHANMNARIAVLFSLAACEGNDNYRVVSSSSYTFTFNNNPSVLNGSLILLFFYVMFVLSIALALARHFYGSWSGILLYLAFPLPLLPLVTVMAPSIVDTVGAVLRDQDASNGFADCCAAFAVICALLSLYFIRAFATQSRGTPKEHETEAVASHLTATSICRLWVLAYLSNQRCHHPEVVVIDQYRGPWSTCRWRRCAGAALDVQDYSTLWMLVNFSSVIVVGFLASIFHGDYLGCLIPSVLFLAISIVQLIILAGPLRDMMSCHYLGDRVLLCEYMLFAATVSFQMVSTFAGKQSKPLPSKDVLLWCGVAAIVATLIFMINVKRVIVGCVRTFREWNTHHSHPIAPLHNESTSITNLAELWTRSDEEVIEMSDMVEVPAENDDDHLPQYFTVRVYVW
jgi:hypothetical protein